MRIGIDLGGTKIEGILLDGSAERARLRVPTPRGDYPGTLEAIAGLVFRLKAEATNEAAEATDEDQTAEATNEAAEATNEAAEATNEDQTAEATDVHQAVTVGIGIPGTLSPRTGLVKNANSTWLIGRPLQQDLERVLGQPIRVANDANCFAVSEAVDGAAAGADVVFGVIVGTGTGAGLVVRGQVVTGPNAIAGEWGHNPLPWAAGDEIPGPECYCGQRGCIETFLSGPAFERNFQLKAEAAGGQVPDLYIDRMARALASVINLLDPDVIVMGGGMSNLDALYDAVPARWGRWVFGGETSTRLVPAAHGDSSGVRGAAWLWPAAP